ncbi:hypothetical protein AYI68_g3688 [Smittium mucronatum]|uniref:Uncharacterized protein n=1 Tax=Smittium mucronatum TaxID=133383 RepID=A0A1R0GZ56_9FUNG|nr:hypothetical protein AYI68_g3688 [Smittium mucronatum]
MISSILFSHLLLSVSNKTLVNTLLGWSNNQFNYIKPTYIGNGEYRYYDSVLMKGPGLNSKDEQILDKM